MEAIVKKFILALFCALTVTAAAAVEFPANGEVLIAADDGTIVGVGKFVDGEQFELELLLDFSGFGTLVFTGPDGSTQVLEVMIGDGVVLVDLVDLTTLLRDAGFEVSVKSDDRLAGRPDDAGRPENVGQPEDRGRPEGAGDEANENAAEGADNAYGGIDNADDAAEKGKEHADERAFEGRGNADDRGADEDVDEDADDDEDDDEDDADDDDDEDGSEHADDRAKEGAGNANRP